MTLKVVGTGLGRTGTLSLKRALEALGVGRCHHMLEVFAAPESVPLWIAAGEGRPDWDAIFEGFGAVVDYPGAAFWRQITARYPTAKVIHTVRDPAAWFESTQATIFSKEVAPAEMPPALQAFFAAWMGDFADRRNDRDYMIEYFKRHTADVVATIPKDRLLVYEAGQGWEPLCAFLGLPIPETPYPSENSRAEFQAAREARIAALHDDHAQAPDQGRPH